MMVTRQILPRRKYLPENDGKYVTQPGTDPGLRIETDPDPDRTVTLMHVAMMPEFGYVEGCARAEELARAPARVSLPIRRLKANSQVAEPRLGRLTFAGSAVFALCPLCGLSFPERDGRYWGA
jgi:hypothetical protein